MKLDELYKRTKTGKVQVWEIEVEDDKFRTTEGQLDGKMTTSEWTVSVGKNIGKSNETTPEQQALKEAQSRFDKKLKKKYFVNLEDIDDDTWFEPMLAYKYKDHKDKVVFPVLDQPKLDGIRCEIRKEGMFSREGNEFTSCPHIFEEVKHLFEMWPNLILDGELYNHEFKANFNKISSLVKKGKKLTEEQQREAETWIQFHCYDCFDDSKTDFPFKDRILFVMTEFDSSGIIIPVYTSVAHNQEELDEHYADFLGMGYEGQMIRVPNSVYENKRSFFLLKRKEYTDEEFEILGMIEGEGNLTGMVGSIECEKDGEPFTAGLKGSHEYWRYMWNNQDEFIGKQATIRYQNLTPDRQVPRFGKMIAIRDYE